MTQLDFEKFTWHKLTSYELRQYQNCIYCIRNLHNDKLYIGKTTYTLYERVCYGHVHGAEQQILRCNKDALHCAIKKYGTGSFVVACIYIAQAHHLNELERFFIATFETYHNGYNLTMGGEGSLGSKLSLESRQRISFLKKGIPINERNREGISKRVYQIDKNTNEIIAEFKSCAEAAQTTGIANIGLCAKGRLKSAGGFLWRYVNEDDKYKGNKSEKTKENLRKKMATEKQKLFSPVQQFDMDDNLIAEYPSQQAAIKATGIKNIAAVCRGFRPSSHGFKWRHKPKD